MSETGGDVSFPAHVDIVKEGLLDFNQFLGLEALMQVLGDENSSEDDDDDIPLSAYKTDGLKASQRAREREFLENAKELAEGALRLKRVYAEDSEWRKLFKTVLTSRNDDVDYSGLCLPRTIAFAENEDWDTDLDASQSSHVPKPDLYLGFPVYSAENVKAGGFGGDPCFQNYTADTLSQLATRGLPSLPHPRSLANIGEAEGGSTKLYPSPCFPWCVIQLKGVEKEATVEESENADLETYSQASIAASSALAMLEKLARFADVKQNGQHIPPVITITSVGPNTTVWLAFSDIVDEQYRDHKMMSIWNGCISNIWDAIQFCRIVDNLFFWSQHILKPKVSQYIDQWRLRYRPEVHNLLFGLEKNLETADLVHRIQDRLSSLDLSPNTNLPELIHQAVIVEEVIRSNLRKTPPNQKAQDKSQSSKNIPSNSKEQTLAVGTSGDGVMKVAEQEDSESEEKEDDKEDHRSRELTLQLRSPEKDTSICSGLPVTYENATNEYSKTIGIKPDRRSTNTKSSTATDVTFSSSPSKGSPTRKFVAESGPPAYSNTDEGDRKPAFSYPYEFKTSDFEFQEEQLLVDWDMPESADLNFIDRQLQLMALRRPSRYRLPLKLRRTFQPSFSHSFASDGAIYEMLLAFPKEPPLSAISAPKTDSNNLSERVTPSAPPNPLITSTLELESHVKPLWGPVLQDETHESIVPSELPHKARPEWDPAEIARPPSFEAKIPWRGKNIRVKLPPVVPEPAGKWPTRWVF